MAGLIDNKNSFAIGNQKFQAKEMRYGWESLATEDSGRTLDGYMHIYWVYRKIRKIEIVLPPCKQDVINNIVNLVQGQEYYLTYYDPAKRGVSTIKCYTSNSSADLYSGVVMNGLWQNFEFHAIELGGE